jgi:2-aminoadipate transaminase
MIDYDAFLSRAAGRMQESAIRKMGTVLADTREMVSFAPGYPAPEAFPWTEFGEIASELLRGDGTVLQYGATRGYRPLLDSILEIMADRGVALSREQILVTTGSQQGLDLVARVLLDPGDVVLVELPSYTGAITAFRNAQADMVGVPQEADGIDLGALDAILARLRAGGRRVRLLYVVPNFQNPTGLLIGRAKRWRLMEWAARHDLLIVEDDPYRELYFSDSLATDAIRSLEADDPEGRVIYLSSFSKTLAPGFRMGWMAAPAAIAAKLELAKQAVDLCSGTFDQRMVYECCRRGVLARLTPELRAHYRHKRDVMVTALNEALGDMLSWRAPQGGFFLWATLPPQLDAERMVERAQANGVIYVPGNAFFVDGGGRNTMRLSFSAPTPERIVEGVRRLAAAVRQEMEAVEKTVPIAE